MFIQLQRDLVTKEVSYKLVTSDNFMRSDRNSFCGYVVLDSVNMASREEDSILDKIKKRKYFIMTILVFLLKYEIHINMKIIFKPNIITSLLLSAAVLIFL